LSVVTETSDRALALSEIAPALGGEGADTISGGSGADSLAGGAGLDLLDYTASGGAVTVDLALGTASGGDAATILTGGWADAVRDVLPDAVMIPDLVLTGIALGAGRACGR
jgi:Ca2+-binding RTX toxin-like protein